MKKQILETIGERAPRRQSSKRINGLEALSFCKPFGGKPPCVTRVSGFTTFYLVRLNKHDLGLAEQKYMRDVSFWSLEINGVITNFHPGINQP